MTSRTTSISGTDPSNPHNAQQIFDELGVIAKNADAAEYRLRQLAFFAAAIRDVLLDQRVSLNQADDRAGEVVRTCKAAAAAVADAVAAMQKAQRAITLSGVRMTEPFEWRPGVPGRR